MAAALGEDINYYQTPSRFQTIQDVGTDVYIADFLQSDIVSYINNFPTQFVHVTGEDPYLVVQFSLN